MRLTPILIACALLTVMSIPSAVAHANGAIIGIIASQNHNRPAPLITPSKLASARLELSRMERESFTGCTRRGGTVTTQTRFLIWTTHVCDLDGEVTTIDPSATDVAIRTQRVLIADMTAQLEDKSK